MSPATPAYTPPAAPAACPNCGHGFAGPTPRFCTECGQETRVKPPTVGEFLQQFGGAYLSTEGALWRTLKLLLFKPGELTRQYLAGRRKHYVLPLRLYLTISLVVLLLLRVFGSGPVQLEMDTPAQSAPASAGNAGTGGTTVTPDTDGQPARKATISILGEGDIGFGLKDGVFYCNQMPQWVCKRAQRRLDIEPKAVASEVESYKDRVVGNVGAALFLLLPSFALWMKLAYWNRRLRYTEHLVFALHVHAFWFMAFALAFAGVTWLTALGCAAVPIYTLLAMKRVYGGRLAWRLLRASFVSLLYLVMLTLAMTGVAIVAVLT